MRASRGRSSLSSMVAAISADVLERLAELESGGQPVLSVYFDLDPDRFPTPAEREAELSALLSGVGARSADAERVRDALLGHHELVLGARGIAIFSCHASGALEVLALPEPVEPLAVLDAVPWLEPIVAMETSEDWSVAVVSRRGARLFRGGPNGLVEFAAFQDELQGRHSQGGWSQARFQRGIEQQVHEHLRHTAELLERAHRRRPFVGMVIVAAAEVWPGVKDCLSPELRDRVVGVVDRDLEHSTVQEIMQAVTPVLDRVAGEHEQALLARLEDALGSGGPAVAGLEEVIAMLDEERIELLLLADKVTLTAGRCPDCGRLSADAEGRCPLDGTQLARVDAAEHLLARAAQGSTDVVVLRRESDALRRRGQVAALLRW